MFVKNQWTEHEEQLIARLLVNPPRLMQPARKIDYAATYPFRTCDIPLPSDDTGFVYMIVSVRDVTRTYVGETKNIDTRFKQHNSGYGAVGTADPMYRPYCMAGYICGMSHVTPSGRMALERRWKQCIEANSIRGDNDIMSRLQQGKRVAQEYNESMQGGDVIANPENLLQFVYTIESKALSQLPTARGVLEGAINLNESERDDDSTAADSMLQREHEGHLV